MLNILIGALTAKPYSFKTRVWELESIKTIDLFDSLCSNIRVDVRGTDIIRVLPLSNDLINECWISDKARYAYDSFERNRFIVPLKRIGISKFFFVPLSWKKLYKIFFSKLFNSSYKNLVISTGNFLNIRHFNELQKFVKIIDKWINVSINLDNYFNYDFQQNYLIDSKIFSSKTKQIFIFIGVNLKIDNPVLNIRFNKLLKNNLIISYVINGMTIQNNKNFNSNTLLDFNKIIRGKHFFCKNIQIFLKKNLKNIKIKSIFKNKINLIFGIEFQNISKHLDYIKYFLYNNLNTVKFAIHNLFLYTGVINANELGFKNYNIYDKSHKNIFYILGVEFIKDIKKTNFNIFQGHYNTFFSEKFNLILPSTIWLEETGWHLNCLGIFQKTSSCILPFKHTGINWKLTNYLSTYINYIQFIYINKLINNKTYDLLLIYNKYSVRKKLLFLKYIWYYQSDNENLTDRWWLMIRCNHLLKVQKELSNSYTKYYTNLKNINNMFNNSLSINHYKKNFKFELKNNFMPLKLKISNYYMISMIDENSQMMQKCNIELNLKNNNFYKQ